jgi:hypothetical protein
MDITVMSMCPETPEAQAFFKAMQKQVLARRNLAVENADKAPPPKSPQLPTTSTCHIPDCPESPYFGFDGDKMYCPDHSTEDMEYYGV